MPGGDGAQPQPGGRVLTGLADRPCRPCRGGEPPLPPGEAEALLGALDGGWEVRDGRLVRTFPFPDFRGALDLAVAIGEAADAADHHPDLHVAWGRLVVTLWTHVVGGLTENDFVLAARIDRLARRPA